MRTRTAPRGGRARAIWEKENEIDYLRKTLLRMESEMRDTDPEKFDWEDYFRTQEELTRVRVEGPPILSDDDE